MAKEPTKHTAHPSEGHAGTGLRDDVLETLLRLHIDFCSLGCIRKAGPLLHSLMELAYYAQPHAKRAPRKRPAKRRANAALN